MFKFQDCTLYHPHIIELDPGAPLLKTGFPGQILQNWDYDDFYRKNARVTKLWSHDHICNIVWATC